MENSVILATLALLLSAESLNGNYCSSLSQISVTNMLNILFKPHVLP